MARYLSDEWFELLGAGPAGPVAEPALVLQHVITGGPDGDTRYHVRVSGGRAVIVRGVATDPVPDATFTEDYRTAASIASGELTTAAALLAGRIRVAGDMASLVSRAGVDRPAPAAAGAHDARAEWPGRHRGRPGVPRHRAAGPGPRTARARRRIGSDTRIHPGPDVDRGRTARPGDHAEW